MNVKHIILLLWAASIPAFSYTLEYRDNFDVVSYSNNDGNGTFSSDWIDSQDNNPAAGDILITGGLLQFTDLDYGLNVARTFDAGGATSVSYSFDVDTSGLADSGFPFYNDKDQLRLECYNGSGWVSTVTMGKSFSGPASGSLDASCLIANAQVRFINPNNDSGGWNSSSSATVDNFSLVVTFPAPPPPDTDGDGVDDDTDIDDDNDGVSDINEGYIDFNRLDTVFNPTGSANFISNTEAQLTPATNGQSGAIQSFALLNMEEDFTYTAEVYLGNNDGGADGMAFVLHNDPAGKDAVGGSGVGLGANGIQNGIYIELDTYDNSPDGADGDMASDHLQIRDSDGDLFSASGAVTSSVAVTNLEDGNWHTLKVVWNAAAEQMDVSLDGTQVLSHTFTDIENNYFGGTRQVHFGYTASTGGLNNDQRVRNITYEGVYVDTDGDGVEDYHDLDSDNDGIPDNIEGQRSYTLSATETGYLEPSGTVTSTGIYDNYPTDGFTPRDTDGDGTPDLRDSDSDNDLITDCVEGLQDGAADPSNSKSCPVDSTNSDPATGVGVNGLIFWAENQDNYSDVNGVVFIDPNGTDSTSSNLYDELWTREVAYREYGCGPGRVVLTAMQWKTFSLSCDMGAAGSNNDIGHLLSGLGTYGDEADWVMYEQLDANYTGNPNTDFRLMDATEVMVPGKGYWIISRNDKNVTISSTPNLRGTTREPASNFPGLPTSGASFEEVMGYNLPDSDAAAPRKVLIGNPFLKKFQLSDLYYQNAAKDANYVPTTALNTGDPMEPVVYVKDSSDTSSNNYEAITPTPGFTDVVPVMQGFWVKLNAGNTNTNKITYPYEK